MIRLKGTYRNQTLELERPCHSRMAKSSKSTSLAEGRVARSWSQLGMERLEQDWDNEKDAVYDNWRKLYGV